MNFDWSNLAFGSKKKVNELHATFIAAPRELSVARFKELVKQYLPKGNILLGIAKEDYVEGFDGQPQFRTLKKETVEPTIEQVNSAKLPGKVYTLEYFQRELPYILQKLSLQRVVLVRGSWQHAFHTRPEYYTLIDRSIAREIVSPFVNQAEASEYEEELRLNLTDWIQHFMPTKPMTEMTALDLASKAAKLSFDYSFQTGAVLGKRIAGKTKRYDWVWAGFNMVVPYQTYALLHGASREDNFSPPNDLNHYDTIHAEVMTLLGALETGKSLEGTTLFINLMPCPSCSRMIAASDIAEVVYSIDHSDGYAIKMLTEAGKKVRRVV